MPEVALTKGKRRRCTQQQKTRFQANMYFVYNPEQHISTVCRTSVISCKYYLKKNLLVTAQYSINLQYV